MKKTSAIFNLFSNVPSSIKGKLIKFSKNDEILTGKVELIIIFGDNLKTVKELVENKGGKFEDLGYGFGIVTIDVANVEDLASINEIQYVELPKTLYTSFEVSNRVSCIDSVWKLYNLTGKGTIVGFMDSGIDYTHPAFIDEAGETRIDYIYDLSDEKKIWNKQDINNALKSTDPYSIVPERDRLGHGTHVAGIACAGGNIDKRYYGVAYESNIIMVKMTGQGKVNYAKSTQLMRGIKFLLDKERELNKPLTINLSFSTNNGAHNGSSLLEQYINTVSSLERVSFVIASGNEGDRAHHVGGTLRDIQTINFSIGLDESVLIMQLYKELLNNIDIEIKNPQGASSGRVKIQQGYREISILKDRCFIYNSGAKPFDINGEVIISFASIEGFLTSGQWSITIYSYGAKAGRYDIWLPVSEGLNENTKFLQPDVFNTLGIPATVLNSISVGSCDLRGSSISAFSGRGALGTDKPNIIAPGEYIESAIPDRRFDALTGTSMATPQVSGACALMMEWGLVNGNDSFMYGNRLKYYLLKGARRNRTDAIYPDSTWGYGALCLKTSLDIAVEDKFRNVYRSNDMNNNFNRMDCSEIYANSNIDNYENYIVEYDGDIAKSFENVNYGCVSILDEKYAVITIEQGKIKNVQKEIKEIIFIDDQALYTLSALSPIDTSNISKFHENEYLTLRGQGVIVGIIDTGIDYLNTEFTYENDKTRIVGIWDQTINTGNKPDGFNFGTEYTSIQINEAIELSKKGGDPYSLVNTKDTIGHGTSMAGIIGGRGKDGELKGAAPDCEFLVVKLKQASKIVLDKKDVCGPNCSVYESSSVILAIKYLFNIARKLNRPMIIYLPVGTNEGAHDGSSVIERYIDEISKIRGIAVVNGSGNEGDTQTHVSGTLINTGDVSTIELNVDERQRNLEFQIWCHKPDKVSISIVSPSGEVIEKIPAKLKEVEEIKFIFEGSTVFVKYLIPEEFTGDELISISIRDIKKGIWKFNLIGDLIVDGRYDAWLPQRALLKGETRFLNSNQYVTLMVPSTSRRILSCANYNQDNNTVLASSGRGYTRDNRVSPFIAVGGFQVLTTSPGGRKVTVSGSSAAAAVLAGACALMMEWGIVKGNDPSLYAIKIKTYLIRGAERRRGDTYPNREWGYGTLNLNKVFENVRKIDFTRNVKKDVFIRIPEEIYNKLDG